MASIAAMNSYVELTFTCGFQNLMTQVRDCYYSTWKEKKNGGNTRGDFPPIVSNSFWRETEIFRLLFGGKPRHPKRHWCRERGACILRLLRSPFNPSSIDIIAIESIIATFLLPSSIVYRRHLDPPPLFSPPPIPSTPSKFHTVIEALKCCLRRLAVA